MDMHGGIFEEDLFGLDLEHIAIPRFPLHFQLPGGDLADEADMAAMGAVGLAGLDPTFAREREVEEAVAEAVARGGGRVGEVEASLGEGGAGRHYARLHVLVCGACRAVFHVIDEFRSHSACCLGGGATPPAADVAAAGLALVLWTDAVLRAVRRRLGGAAGEPKALRRRVEAGWCRQGRRAKLCWERAAEVLVEAARVGRRVFTSAMEQDISCTLPCPGDQWPGPLDFLQADEIHGVELDMAEVAEVAGVELDMTGLQAGREGEAAGSEDRDKDNTRTTADIGTQTEHTPSDSFGSSNEVIRNGILHRSNEIESKNVSNSDEAAPSTPTAADAGAVGSGSAEAPRGPGIPVKRPGYLATMRNKRGRWEAVAREEVATFLCSPCSFTTATEWKLRRHRASSKHLARLASLSSETSDCCPGSGPGFHPVPVPVLDSGPDPGPSHGPDPDPRVDPDPGPDPDSGPDQGPGPDPGSSHGLGPEPVSDPGPEQSSGPDPGPGQVPDPDPSPDPCFSPGTPAVSTVGDSENPVACAGPPLAGDGDQPGPGKGTSLKSLKVAQAEIILPQL